MLKRKRPESGGCNQAPTPGEKVVYNAIKSKTNMGISKAYLKRELSMKDGFEQLHQEPPNEGQNKRGKKMLKARRAISWFVKICVAMICKKKVSTAEQVAEMVTKSGAITVKISVDRIKKILKTLILDGQVMEVKRTGCGEYASIPAGMDCYRSARKAQADGGGIRGAMVSIPCGVCPRINHCTPDGAISPITCDYYNQWLDF